MTGLQQSGFRNSSHCLSVFPGAKESYPKTMVEEEASFLLLHSEMWGHQLNKTSKKNKIALIMNILQVTGTRWDKWQGRVTASV